ncbi:MAG: threonylcarbamoyladenosine tRNA methylthiotransferase MtaB [Methylobacteriaceae bacterium]|nr:threonylcarbamoyladenosine tRNA methylthiotransferase MtaB [Methylobacteriaceae bacterium]
MTVQAPVEVLTFGCRLNLVESEARRRAASAAGQRDLVIVNTCAVTAEATRQARQAIRRVARQRPQARIVATGCAVEVDRAAFAAMGEIAAIVPNAQKTGPATWGAPAALDTPPGIEGHTRGFVAIQNGCDHRCTFCVIPFGRGASRSLPAGKIVAETQALVASGHREVVLTGVDLTSWGADLRDRPRLGELVTAILAEVPDLARLRLSSLDMGEIDPPLLEAIGREQRLMPHLHLSLQSGNDLILKRMKRRHSRAAAIRLCRQVRALRPDMVFGADIIAGFPTETEAMFDDSLALIEECGLVHVHAFPYSPRPGTPAARMPQVAPEVARARAARLRQAGAAAFVRHLDAQVGRRITVLAERSGRGRAEDFTPVHLPGARPGLLMPVEVIGHDGRTLAVSQAPSTAAPPALPHLDLADARLIVTR